METNELSGWKSGLARLRKTQGEREESGRERP